MENEYLSTFMENEYLSTLMESMSN